MDLKLQLLPEKAAYSRNQPIRLTWSLTNSSPNEILVLSHYATTERRHFDHTELEIVRADDQKVWNLPLFGARKGVAKVGCLMAPGDTLKHAIDLASWLNLHHIDIGAGKFNVTATYRVGPTESAIGAWVSCKDVTSVDDRELRFAHGASRFPWRGVTRSNRVVLQIGE